MIRQRIRKGALIVMVMLQVLMPILPAIAGLHPLAGVTDKNADGIQDVDITISLDWDPAEVTGKEEDPRGRTTKEFEAIIKSYAGSLFSMTNGLHRLRNVFVFKDEDYWDEADIRYFSGKGGRPRLCPNGRKKPAGSTCMSMRKGLHTSWTAPPDRPLPMRVATIFTACMTNTRKPARMERKSRT